VSGLSPPFSKRQAVLRARHAGCDVAPLRHAPYLSQIAQALRLAANGEFERKY
jgi:hypothetical protein